MSIRIVFDLETTPIGPDPRHLPGRVWCVVARDVDTGVENVFLESALLDAADYLRQADLLIGHNIAKFDVPIMEALGHPVRGPWGEGHLYDTLCGSNLVFASNRYERMIAFRNSAGRDEEKRERKLPRRFLKAHSLESWGYLLGRKKLHADVDLSFYEKFSDELLERCRRDVELNVEVFRSLTCVPAERGWPAMPLEPVIVESEFAYLLGAQERNGVGFDREAAEALERTLAVRRAELTTSLQAAFPAWYAPKSGQKGHDPEMPRRDGDAGYTVPKATRNMKPTASRPWPSVEGGTHTKVGLVEFNPGSGHHIAHVLRARGWRPTEFTDKGDVSTTEDVLARLDYPEIPTLLEYMTVDKRLGSLSEGPKSWLKSVKPSGLIHGRVNPTGTRTSRCSHVGPNLGQVPKNKSPYGRECRSLFRPTRSDWVMVGADASGLELRMLAHRLAFYDGGAFGVTLLSGDPHEEWRLATGMFYRENQKTFTYAMLYGAGPEKLGLIILADWREAFEKRLTTDRPPRLGAAIDLGKTAQGRLFRNVPALASLVAAIRGKHEQGWFRALDGRILAIKSEHSALNDLLQSDGAIVMKHALLGLDWKLTAAGLRHGTEFAYLLNVHDEWQIETYRHCADVIGELAVDAIRATGESLGLRCPLDGEFKVGNNWSETH